MLTPSVFMLQLGVQRSWIGNQFRWLAFTTDRASFQLIERLCWRSDGKRSKDCEDLHDKTSQVVAWKRDGLYWSGIEALPTSPPRMWPRYTALRWILGEVCIHAFIPTVTVHTLWKKGPGSCHLNTENCTGQHKSPKTKQIPTQEP